jgi:hypothetical protein
VFVVGSRRTSDNPVRTDGMVWVYQWTEGEDVYVQPPTVLRAPFTPDEFDPDLDNDRSEWARAVVVDAAGNALVVGEREYKDDMLQVYSRAFAVQVHPFGQVLGTPWTSWAPAFRTMQCGRSVRAATMYVAGGWTRDFTPTEREARAVSFLVRDRDASPSPTARRDPESTVSHVTGRRRSSARRPVPRALPMLRSSRSSGHRTRPSGTSQGVADADGAGAVACDHRGFCGWGGYRTTNAKPYAVVRVHHP